MTSFQIAEFLAEETTIEITINRRMNQINLIEPVGPFELFKRQSVPLWFALLLRQKGKASIVIPEWMHVQYLREWLQKEQESPLFSPAPFHYIEVAKLLRDQYLMFD
jgi:GINS complex subunit 2